MSFKTKALGMLAGSALMLSVATGAMAEEVTVTLEEKPNVQGCVFTSIELPNLETTWDGSRYTDPNLKYGYVTLGFDSAFPGETGTCALRVWGTAFEGQNDSTETFGISRLIFGGFYSVSGDSDNPTLFYSSANPGSTVSVPLTLNLEGVTVPPDDYVSTLTFTITTNG